MSSDANVVFGQTSLRVHEGNGGFRWTKETGFEIFDLPLSLPLPENRTTVSAFANTTTDGACSIGSTGFGGGSPGTPLVWTREQGLKLLAAGPFNVARVSDIDDSGNIFVGRMNNGTGKSAAAIWEQGVVRELPSIKVGLPSSASSISNDGTVILGDMTLSSNRFGASTKEAVVVWRDDVPAVLETFNNHSFSATKLSGDGSTVAFTVISQKPRSYIRPIAGKRRLLSSLGSDYPSTSVRAIAGDGSFAVGYGNDRTTLSTVTVWRKTGAARSLADILVKDYNIAPNNENGFLRFEDCRSLCVKDGKLIFLINGSAKKEDVNIVGFYIVRIALPGPADFLLPNSGDMLIKTVKFSPRIRFSEIATDFPKESKIAVSMTASMLSLSGQQPDGQTPISVRIGDFVHSAVLADDPLFHSGRKFVKFPLLANGTRVGWIQYRWNNKTLNVTASARKQSSYSISSRENLRWDGFVEQEVPVQINFGAASGGYKLGVHGKGSTKISKDYERTAKVSLNGSEKIRVGE